jgi:Ca-activated chloride channel homolog
MGRPPERGRVRRRRAASAAALALFLGSAAPAASAEGCALELILAVDVSGSIDDREFALQMEGLASAFEDPALVQAIEAQEGGVLVTLTQWSGASRQRQVTSWQLLKGGPSMAGFAREIRHAGRDWRNYSTAIGEALRHALRVGESAPQACRRRVVDVSGDGVNNEGRAPRAMADALAAIGYTVNGLVIRGDTPDPVKHYEVNVLAGPRAFLEIAASFDDYPEAIRRKLLREVEERALVSQADAAR